MSNLKRFSKIYFFSLLFCFVVNLLYSQTLTDNFIVGADLSSLQQYENAGVKFFDSENNEISDLLKFFCDKNLDCVRLRVWVNPELAQENSTKTKYCNLENSIKMAKRVKSLGMKVLIDFHYSDYWADPAQQNIPKKWQEKISLKNENDAKTELHKILFNYTTEALQKFKDENIQVDFVQIGNEITNGILFPYGTIKEKGSDVQKFSDLASILKEGINATRKIFPESKIILHIDSSGDLNRCLWWFSCAEKSNLDYDIIGLSYYSLWHGTDLSKLETCVKTLSQKFDKSVFIVETAYPFTLGWKDNLSNLYGMKNQLIEGFEASPQGQKSYFEELCSIMKSSVKNHLSAVFWWEPTCTAQENLGLSSTIENITWFDFQNRYIGPL